MVYYTPAFYFMQVIETRIVYYLVTLGGIDAALVGPVTISYPPPLYGIETAPDCTAVTEMFILTGLIIGFTGSEIRREKIRTLKSLVVFNGVLFIENLVRMCGNYPIARAYGLEAWETIHFLWWKWVQYAVIVVLFLVWVYIYQIRGEKEGREKGEAKKEDRNKVNNGEEPDHKRKEGKEKDSEIGGQKGEKGGEIKKEE